MGIERGESAMESGVLVTIEVILVLGVALVLAVWELIAVRRSLARDRDQRDRRGMRNGSIDCTQDESKR